MTTEEYKALKQRNNQHGIIEHLHERSRTFNAPIHDLEALYQSLVYDQSVASRTHNDWKPAEVNNLNSFP